MKKRYKLYDIEWDTDDDLVADEGLPKFEFVESEFSLKELAEGEAADYLSDKYGYCVKSLRVDEAKDGEKMFTVFMERVEKYSLPVNVLATDAASAESIVRELEKEGDYEEYWDELQPDVSMEYGAEESESVGRGEGPLK